MGEIMNDPEYQKLIDHEIECLTVWSHLKSEADLFKAKQILINLVILCATLITVVVVLLTPGMWFMIPLPFMFASLLWGLFHNFGSHGNIELPNQAKEAYQNWVEAKAATMKYTLEEIYGTRKVGD